MKSTTVNGFRYAYNIHQQDDEVPDLLILHGFMGDQRAFDHLIDPLCTFCNPITVDLLGHGKSSAPTNPEHYRENRQIDNIATLISELESSPLWLYGYSMGGRMALKTAISHPQFFSGLILESTTCGITDSTNRKERRKTDAKWAESIKKDFEKFLSEWKELDLFQSPAPINKSLAEKYHNIQSEQSPSALAASLHGFGTGSMTPACGDLKTLALPTLLLGGSADEKYQRINRYLVNQLPNATFSSIQAGHRVHLDNPTGFTAALKHYLKENI